MAHYRQKYFLRAAMLLLLIILCFSAFHIFADSKNSSFNKNNSSGTAISKEIVALNSIENRIYKANNYINYLDIEIAKTEDSIQYFSDLLNNAGNNRNIQRKELTRLTAEIYIQPKKPFDEFLISSNSGIDESDEVYFRKIAESTIIKNREISTYIDSTHLIIDNLYSQSLRHQELLATKSKENTELINDISNKGNLLETIRKNTFLLEEYLNTKINSATEIKNIISNFSENHSKKFAEKVSPKASTLPFGKLSWPVNSRNILISYGKVRGNTGNIILDNPGIDIKISTGTNVIATAEGTISDIRWLPGFGSLIIINHGNNIRTVYANLSEFHIRKGDKINKGDIIGKSGESINGESVHFELWWGDRRLNPLPYLK